MPSTLRSSPPSYIFVTTLAVISLDVCSIADLYSVATPSIAFSRASTSEVMSFSLTVIAAEFSLIRPEMMVLQQVVVGTCCPV